MVLIAATAERRRASVVAGLEGEKEMVIKGTGRQLRHVAGIAGSTVMGSGEVVLVLNVADLIQLTLRAGRRVVRAVARGEREGRRGRDRRAGAVRAARHHPLDLGAHL